MEFASVQCVSRSGYHRLSRAQPSDRRCLSVESVDALLPILFGNSPLLRKLLWPASVIGRVRQTSYQREPAREKNSACLSTLGSHWHPAHILLTCLVGLTGNRAGHSFLNAYIKSRSLPVLLPHGREVHLVKVGLVVERFYPQTQSIDTTFS
jgi:hypothetical protein